MTNAEDGQRQPTIASDQPKRAMPQNGQIAG
jgi:hypothetical protein